MAKGSSEVIRGGLRLDGWADSRGIRFRSTKARPARRRSIVACLDGTRLLRGGDDLAFLVDARACFLGDCLLTGTPLRHLHSRLRGRGSERVPAIHASAD